MSRVVGAVARQSGRYVPCRCFQASRIIKPEILPVLPVSSFMLIEEAFGSLPYPVSASSTLAPWLGCRLSTASTPCPWNAHAGRILLSCPDTHMQANCGSISGYCAPQSDQISKTYLVKAKDSTIEWSLSGCIATKPTPNPPSRKAKADWTRKPDLAVHISPRWVRMGMSHFEKQITT